MRIPNLFFHWANFRIFIGHFLDITFFTVGGEGMLLSNWFTPTTKLPNNIRDFIKIYKVVILEQKKILPK
jgi:hypothetical protein